MHKIKGRDGKLRANFGRAASRRRLLVLMIVAGAVTALLAGAYRERPARAAAAQAATPTPPSKPADYSKVDDFLGGQRNLLPKEDFFVGYSATLTDTTDLRSAYLSATTDNSAPTLEYSGTLPTNYPTDFVAGRFFQTGYDITLQFLVKPDSPNHYTLRGFGRRASDLVDYIPQQAIPDLPVLQFPRDLYMVSAVGDFNGDGYDDVALSYPDATASLRILTAVDVNDPQKGFKFGPPLEFRGDPSSSPYAGLRQITTGDFNGDGLSEIAGIYVTNPPEIRVDVYSVNPQTLRITPAGVIALAKAANVGPLLQIAAGRFAANSTHDQLLAAWLINQNGSDTPKVDVIDFVPGALQPKVISTWDSRDFGVRDQFTPFTMKLKTARFDWTSYTDQAVWMVGTPGTGTRLSVLKVDPQDLTISRASDISIEPNPRFHGMELGIGNFDKMKPSLMDPNKMEPDPNSQIGVMGRDMAYKVGGGDCGANVPGEPVKDCYKNFLHTYSVDPRTFAITKSGESMMFGFRTRIAVGQAAEVIVNKFWLLPADLRGRSLRLGQGYKITVDRAAPSVVLAAPPMHADYINPGLGKPPTVLNLSVAPDGFHSEYEQTDSSEMTITNKSKTSSTFAGEEKISASATFGTFDVITGELQNGVKLSEAFTAKQDIKNSSEAANGTFSSTEVKVSQETGLSDVVWFKDTSYYLYVYPVLGQKVCPADKPNCAEGDKVPLRIMFSAPKEATVQRLATDTLEWYQPPWEYGNIFSYPATLAQLKQYLPSLNLLTQEGTIFATDDANATLETTWSNGQTTGQSVSYEQLFSEENDLSIEGKTEVEFFGGGEAEGGLEVNLGGSNGLETLRESENRINSAKGITVQKRSIFADPFSYKYFFSPYIFGKQEPTGISDPVITNADLTTFGALRSAFTADPLASGAGGWWRQTYSQLPDVALNHPNRWSYGSSPRPQSGNIPSNCVGVDALTMNCVQPAEREPENPWLDPFHDMRGLFITKAENPGEGPQQQMATAGDLMSLQARVYNYSLKALPAGAKVKVRFYGMQWDTNTNLPAKDEGESFLIGETTLDPIPPFSNALGAPLNWVLAGTTFDTTAYENQDLVFWVAVWAEDADGKLVQELASHGLTGIPEANPNPTFADAAGLEEMVKNPLDASGEDVSFSNNIGFYRSAFSVLSKETATAAAVPAGRAEIKLGKVQVDAAARELGQKVEVSTMVRAAHNLYGVSVYFYDGDPQAGGRLFDVERLAVLRAGEQHKFNIHFRPQGCGEHRIFVTAGKGRDYEVSRSSGGFQVNCQPPQQQCVMACFRAPQYYLNNLWAGLPRGEVWVAGVEGPVDTRNVRAISQALRGGSSAVRSFNRQYVAMQLSMLKVNTAGERRQMLNGTLSCYGVNGANVVLSNRAAIGPATSLRDLLGRAEWAARGGRSVDMQRLTPVLDAINSDDAAGGCVTAAGGAPATRGVTPPPSPVSNHSGWKRGR